MAEAVIVRRGASEGGTNPSNARCVMIIENTQWRVPKAKGQKFSVRLFGGGGYGGVGQGRWGGGGGGHMNNAVLTIPEGENIQINIGLGGGADFWDKNSTDAGGTTFFGSYLSALGGQQSIGYDGGNGGTGGGGGTGMYNSIQIQGRGGDGSYGGGGGVEEHT